MIKFYAHKRVRFLVCEINYTNKKAIHKEKNKKQAMAGQSLKKQLQHNQYKSFTSASSKVDI